MYYQAIDKLIEAYQVRDELHHAFGLTQIVGWPHAISLWWMVNV
jgi:hypothetical protein